MLTHNSVSLAALGPMRQKEHCTVCLVYLALSPQNKDLRHAHPAQRGHSRQHMVRSGAFIARLGHMAAAIRKRSVQNALLCSCAMAAVFGCLVLVEAPCLVASLEHISWKVTFLNAMILSLVLGTTLVRKILLARFVELASARMNNAQ